MNIGKDSKRTSSALTPSPSHRHHSTAVQTPALRSVGNIVTGDDLQTQVVLASGALPALLSLLGSPKEGIRKEACWTVSNITAGSPQQIQAVIDANIIPPLINILQNADFKTKKEACWAMSNATSGGLQEPSQIRYLVSQGCIKPLCDLLKSNDNKIIQVALDGLENILKVGESDKEVNGGVNQYAAFVEEAGGMLSIHNLQHHENLEVSLVVLFGVDESSRVVGAALTSFFTFFRFTRSASTSWYVSPTPLSVSLPLSHLLLISPTRFSC